MYSPAYKNRAQHYTDVHNVSGVGEDSPHRLIQMLMEGFLARINSAKGAIAHGDFEAKSVFISRAIGIVGGLNEALDLEQGGDLAINLNQLYGYINSQLVQASYENSEAKLDEVAALMKDIKEAWDAIA
jgi:flagellar protein FliS